MYNAAFIDEMFAKAQENATAVVRNAKSLLEERFGVSGALPVESPSRAASSILTQVAHCRMVFCAR